MTVRETEEAKGGGLKSISLKYAHVTKISCSIDMLSKASKYYATIKKREMARKKSDLK